MSKRIPICKADIAKDLDNAMKPPYLNAPPKVQFEVYLEVDDDLYDDIKDDAKLAAYIFEASSDVYKEAKEKMIKLAKEANQECKDKDEDDRYKVAVGLLTDFKAIISKAEDDIEKDAESQVKKWMQVRKEKRNFKIKAYMNGILGAFGVAVSAHGLLAAPLTAGSSAVLAIYGIAKGLVGIANEIKSCWAKLESSDQAVRKTLNSVIVSYKDISKSGLAARELGSAILEKITKVEAPTIGRASKELDVYKNAVNKLDVSIGDYATALNQLLDKWETVDKGIIEKANALLKSEKQGSKEMEALFKTWKEGGKEIMKKLKDVEDGIKQTEECRAREKFYAIALKEFEDMKGGFLRAAEVAVSLADFSYNASGVTINAVALTNVLTDAVSEYQEIRDLAKK